MYSVQLPTTINRIMSLFYRIGLWNRGDEPSVKERRLKIFYSIYYVLFPVSLLFGAILSESKEETLFLLEVAIVTTILLLKLFYIIWNQKKILEITNRICVYSVDGHEEFTLVNDKLKKFMKFVHIPLATIIINGFGCTVIIPLIGSKNKLFFAIAFPLDWKNNDFAYWMASTFVLTQVTLSIIAFLMTLINWTIMINCYIKYEVLGSQLRKLGDIKIIKTSGKQRQISKSEKENKFLEDTIEAIKFNNSVREDNHQMELFLSPVFFVQLATSGICICASVFCLVFMSYEHLIELMMHATFLSYNVFEILMIMYFGEEIKSSSDRLTYCVFESDWTNQPQSTKQRLIIFAEFLKRPYVLVVAKMYPLTLETFTRILNGAYSMFNILKNFR